MGIMTTVFTSIDNNKLPDSFVGVREDGTAMVFVFDELVDCVEHDVLAHLLCGDIAICNLPENVGMTQEDFIAMEKSIADEANVAEYEQMTQEYILEHKMLHGYDPREDW